MEEPKKKRIQVRNSTRPWMVAAKKILADGEWHTKEEVWREVGKHIPPGVAYRHHERKRQVSYNRKHGLPREAPVPRQPGHEINQEMIILGGKRALLSESFPYHSRCNFWFEWNKERTHLRKKSDEDYQNFHYEV